MTQIFNKRQIIPISIFVSPFIIQLIIDTFLFEIKYYFFTTDGTESAFGMGLGWVKGLIPLPLLHHPDYFFQQISALMVLITGIPENNLFLFNQIGITINIIFLFFSAYWISLLSEKLKLNNKIIFIISILSASMPTIQIYLNIWNFYFPWTILLPALGLSIVAISLDLLKDKKIIRLTYFIFGFIVACYTANLILLISWLFYSLYQKIRQGENLNLFLMQYKKVAKNLSYILLPLLIMSSFWVLITYILHLPDLTRYYCISILVIVLLVYIIYLIQNRKKLFVSNLSIGILGWIIGTNVMASLWFVSLKEMVHISSSGSSISISNILPDIINRLSSNFNPYYIYNFLKEDPWHYLLPFVMLFCAISILFYKKLNKNSDYKFFVFIICIFMINIFLVGSSAFRNYYEMPPSQYGLRSRYFLILLFPISGLILYVHKNFQNYLKTIFLSFVCILSLISYLNYFFITYELSVNTKNVISNINRIINNHLNEDSLNKIYYVRNVHTANAGLLYSLNNYRPQKSLKYWQKISINNGREIYLHGKTEFLAVWNSKKVNHGLFIHKGETTPQRILNTSKTLYWYSEKDLFVSKIKD